MRSIISAGTQLVSPRVLRSPLRPMRTASRAPMRLPSTRIRVFSGPMPRRSIWRLLPYWPEALLPVRLTPGMVRNSSAMSLAGGRRAISSAVMVEVPSAWRAICEAVTCTVSISVASVSAWAVRALPASRAATASASGRGEWTTAGDMIRTFWQGCGASGKGLEATTRGEAEPSCRHLQPAPCAHSPINASDSQMRSLIAAAASMCFAHRASLHRA